MAAGRITVRKVRRILGRETAVKSMFTLPADATDDDLRDGVTKWFCLLATGALDDANAFLDTKGSAEGRGHIGEIAAAENPV